ncbi:MAG TPA: hypothetical protein VFO79_13495, partial [Xanthomonadales bacterium]|nr:hypothetical protein [Xanthomonadales bacterium]
MNFQIDFGNFIQPVATANAPLYASVDGVAHPLGGDECVFQDRATGEVHAMTVQVLQALDMTREFRTLDEHCAAIAQRLGGLAGQADAVRRVIDGLIQRGLVISDSQYLARLVVPSARVPAPLRAVFVRGGGRAGALDRLLHSLAAGEAKSGARRRYVVLDGDAAALRRFAAATGARVTHVDAAARRALAERLA